MNLKMAIITTCFLVGGTVYAQSPAPASAQPPAQKQPGTPAQPEKPAANPGVAPSQLLPALRQPPEQDDPVKDAAIHHLMDVTGTSKMGDQMLNNMTAQIHNIVSRALPPDRVQKFMDQFNQNFHQRLSPGQVSDTLVPIYASHFSLDDIKGLAAFYESPLGQRVLQTLPQVSQESQTSASQLIKGNALQVVQSMTDEYPELKPLLQGNGGAKPQAAPSSDQPAPAPHLAQPSQPPHQ
ncbi:MAG TPA: DUF2059 domain-containing protein [Candidatus Angelobacter sp.]|jgi:hypothetical protein|nr:DUF2059 domain-containing protein [Candidatus Angelobacter sp.]